MSKVLWYEVMPFKPPIKLPDEPSVSFLCPLYRTRCRPTVVSIEASTAIGNQKNAIKMEHGRRPWRVLVVFNLMGYLGGGIHCNSLVSYLSIESIALLVLRWSSLSLGWHDLEKLSCETKVARRWVVKLWDASPWLAGSRSPLYTCPASNCSIQREVMGMKWYHSYIRDRVTSRMLGTYLVEEVIPAHMWELSRGKRGKRRIVNPGKNPQTRPNRILSIVMRGIGFNGGTICRARVWGSYLPVAAGSDIPGS